MKLALLALLATSTEALRLRPKTMKVPSFAQAFMKAKQPAEPTDKEVFAMFD